ncbi:glucose dehydrogenase [FAD, quinone]-like [Pectinophora gossypiella]|uniref:glucose dehydrogenase [FAD, quinone]-like n=1 Tax=Pectinophora gossypiella TaxID=13191 RepID=UPI00214ED3E4|nr:glucose dehydrogenase [FAD, quinone]-like [Pectinophora gossypiella]
MRWQPADLAQACPLDTNISACSSLGFLFLNIVANLYGGSKDIRIQKEIGDDERKVNEDIDGYDRKVNEECDEEYDFVVVGAGSAGCVVASRLSEVKQWKVLLLEAGPEQPDVTLVPALSETLPGSSIDWGYQTQPDPYSCLSRKDGKCSWARGKVMGGTSSINSMVCVRGHPLDYDEWAAAGNVGWSYKDVLPFFRKAERNLDKEAFNLKYHGVHGPQSVSRFPLIDRPSRTLFEGLKQLGLRDTDVTAGDFQNAAFLTQAFGEKGERVSTNTAYIQPIRYKRKNLTVKPNSEAVRILIDDNKRAYGVEYVKNGKQFTATARKEIIVSSGTINSPKLLMLSGIGPRNHLKELNIPVKQDLPVGENLHNHVTFTGMIIAFDRNTSTLVDHEEMLEQTKEYKDMKVKRGPMSSTGIYNTMGFLKSDESLQAPDIQFQSYQIFLHELLEDPVTFERLKIFPNSFYNAIIIRPQNLIPNSRGKVLLNATNPDGPPLLYAGYLVDPDDLIPIKKGVQFIKNLEYTEPFQSGRAKFIKYIYPACRHTEWGSDEYTECMSRHYTFALGHQVGTCKMGADWDPTAVVDPRLRVYGVAGLRVIDNSIMPKITRGNTNGPAIMIGEKGASMVIEDWLHNYVAGEKTM